MKKARRLTTLFLGLALSYVAALTGSTPVVAESPVLTIYTTDSFVAPWGGGPQAKRAFENKCNCSVIFVSFPSAREALNALAEEGKKTKADLILGLDAGLMSKARESKLLTPHDLNLSRVDLPGGWRDSLFVPYGFGYLSFIYSHERVRVPPESLELFAKLSARVRLVLQNPLTSDEGLAFVLWTRLLYGDRAADFWRALEPNVVAVEADSDLALARLNRGDADFVLSTTTMPLYYHKAALSPAIDSLIFDEGHYMLIRLAAIVNASKNKELARAFLLFMGSENFQNKVPTTDWLYPMDLGLSSLPSSLLALSVPSKAYLMDESEIGSGLARWLDDWQQIFGSKTVLPASWDAGFDIVAARKMIINLGDDSSFAE